jgi:hypothetical protein
MQYAVCCMHPYTPLCLPSSVLCVLCLCMYCPLRDQQEQRNTGDGLVQSACRMQYAVCVYAGEVLREMQVQLQVQEQV